MSLLELLKAMKLPSILPMDSRLMPLSRARVDVAQTHRFPEFQQAPRPLADVLGASLAS
ncbi:MAG: hypothetical protein QE570_10530 [Verrucomicrobiota bacterium]|jgi:hypothetical protein|nr:hypothetical protein [Verrucomicrobiota bacterium]